MFHAQCREPFLNKEVFFSFSCIQLLRFGILVLVKRRSSILGGSSLRRAHFRSNQQGVHVIWRPQVDEGVGWAVCGWAIARRNILQRQLEKYQPLRWELTKLYPDYNIVQLNVIMDVLGEWSKKLNVEKSKIFGARSSDVLKRMQKAVLSSSLNIVRSFKVTTK